MKLQSKLANVAFALLTALTSIAITGVTQQPAQADSGSSAWAIVPSPSPLLDPQLSGVSCVSTSFCAASGFSYQSGNFIESWDGTAWSIVPSPNKGWLFGVSCISPNN